MNYRTLKHQRQVTESVASQSSDQLVDGIINRSIAFHETFKAVEAYRNHLLIEMARADSALNLLQSAHDEITNAQTASVKKYQKELAESEVSK